MIRLIKKSKYCQADGLISTGERTRETMQSDHRSMLLACRGQRLRKPGRFFERIAQFLWRGDRCDHRVCRRQGSHRRCASWYAIRDERWPPVRVVRNIYAIQLRESYR